NEARGDLISLKSLEFEALPEGEAAKNPDWLERIDLMSLLQLAISAIVILALGLFVVRPLLAGPRSRPLSLAPPPSDQPLPALVGDSDGALGPENGMILAGRGEGDEPASDP